MKSFARNRKRKGCFKLTAEERKKRETIIYNSKKIVEKEGLKKLLREKLTRHN